MTQELKPKRKYVCTMVCQKRDDEGNIQLYEVGQPAWFSEPPEKHFIPADAVGGAALDMNVTPEQTLRDDSIIPLEDIVTFIKGMYNIDLSGYGRDKVVDYLISARSAPMENINAVGATAPTAAEFGNNPNKTNDLGMKVDFDDDGTGLGADNVDPAEAPADSTPEETGDALDDLLNEE